MTTLWLLSALAPLTAVLALGLAGLAPARTSAALRERVTRLAPATVAPAAALALAGPAAGAVDLPWLLLGTTLAVDAVARPLLLVAALLYVAALVAVGASGAPRAPLLTAFLLVSFVGNAGVFVAADAVTFYLAFAVMSFAGYGLVVHERTGDARRAGRIYLVLTVVSEAFILAGLLLVVNAGGLVLADAPAAVAASPAAATIVALLLLGFGVKAGTVPLHVWLPLAHPAAPPPASAVLSGTMIKAGLVGWLRFLPLGELAAPGWGVLLVVLALLGAFLAVPAGILQSDAKVALAYSSISQMGFLSVLVGVALAAPELAGASTVAAVLYAVHHGLAKGALFLGVPVWRAHGGGPARWLVVAGVAGAALAVAGAPFSSGAVAKYAAKEAVAGASVAGFDLVVLLPFVGTGSTLLLARFGWLLLRGEGGASPVGALLSSWLVLVTGGVVLTWLLAGWWIPVTSVPGLEAVTLWEATWPVLLGAALAAVGWWLSHLELLPGWAAHPDGRALPAGDLVVLEEAAARRGGRLADAAAATLSAAGARASRRWAARTRSVPSPPALVRRVDAVIDRWHVSGLLVLVLVLAAVLAGLP